MSEQKSFFSTLPGIITALAGLVTAIAGLLYALSETGLIGSRGKDETKPAAVAPKEFATATPKIPEAAKKPVAPKPVAETPKAPVAATPKQPVGEATKQTEVLARRTPAKPKEQTTDGWAIIGYYQQGKFSDLTLMVHGERPAAGRSYEAVKDFRLVLKRQAERGEKVITLGMVHQGDLVEVLEIDFEPGTRKVPVHARLRAVLHPIERSTK